MDKSSATVSSSVSSSVSTVISSLTPSEGAPSTGGVFAIPRQTTWRSVRWTTAISISVVHLVALLAVLPWLFSWSGLIIAIAGVYVFGTLGINICYHRLLTHRSFNTPRWLERTFAVLALCCLEGSPVSWVANHRMHHQHSDKEEDPHSPVIAFLWSHIGWLLIDNGQVHSKRGYERYARDIAKDPFYAALNRNDKWVLVYLAHAALFFIAGCGFGALFGGESVTALQMGLSWLVWGVFVRNVLVWHITWSVNSITHLAGYRNYETNENSRNNWIVAILANGEGWHNNHHADQRSAAHGHKWYEFDVTYLTILGLKMVGLASDIVKPRCKDPSRRADHHYINVADGTPKSSTEAMASSSR